jgi:hypothetical protein
MTAFFAATLAILALCDGVFAGFRSSLGRTGLIDHRREDRQAALRGGVLVIELLAPIGVAAAVDALLRPAQRGHMADAGAAMLSIYGPYALIVGIALTVYLLLGWRQRYLASAIVLGPFTFLRPVVALSGAVAAVIAGRDPTVGALAVLSVVVVLAVEPLADRRWYRDRIRSGPAVATPSPSSPAARS